MSRHTACTLLGDNQPAATLVVTVTRQRISGRGAERRKRGANRRGTAPETFGQLLSHFFSSLCSDQSLTSSLALTAGSRPGWMPHALAAPENRRLACMHAWPKPVVTGCAALQRQLSTMPDVTPKQCPPFSYYLVRCGEPHWCVVQITTAWIDEESVKAVSWWNTREGSYDTL